MKTIKNIICLLILFSFVLLEDLAAQDITRKDIYIQFDKLIGIENSDLYNGIAYNELHQIDPEENKFLFPSEMHPGDIVYDGKTYYNILLNYNIYNDVVLVKLKNDLATHIFQLITDKIEAFEVNNSKYKRISGNQLKKIPSGIYKILYTDENRDIVLMEKHRLKERKNLNDKVTVYMYKKQKSHFVLRKYGELFFLQDKIDFQKVFPGSKKEIVNFYKEYNSLRKSNQSEFMTKLIELLILKK